MLRSLSSVVCALLFLLSVLARAEYWDDEGFTLQEVSLSPTNSRFNEEFFASARGQQIQQKLNEAMPQIQKALIVRDHLPTIIDSFEFLSGSGNSENIRTIRSAFGSRYRDYFVDAYRTKFQIGGIFRVEGVGPGRLAVNTGEGIIFNAVGLGEKSRSLAELTQLWLHEILHNNPKESQASRDAFAARVAAFVAERTQEHSLPSGEKIISLNLPQPRLEKIVKEFPNAFDQMKNELQKSFLLVNETKTESRVNTDIFDGFRSYQGRLGSTISTWSDHSTYGTYLTWPHIEVKNLRVSSQGQILLDYVQQDLKYRYEVDSTYQLFPADNYSSQRDNPKIPPLSFRLSLDPKKGETALERTYGSLLADGDFEIHHVQDQPNRRFVSIRLNIPDDMKRFDASSKMHLIGTAGNSRTAVSAVVTTSRFLTKDEVLLHFEIPPGPIEISRLAIPEVSDEGIYSERNLLPSKSQKLDGAGRVKLSQLVSGKMQIVRAELKTDASLAKIRIQSQKKVVGITLEMGHSVSIWKPQWNGSQRLASVHQGQISVGRKYYVPEKDLRLTPSGTGTEFSFEVPKEVIHQTVSGPRITNTVSRFYKFTETLRSSSLIDSLHREISATWIHYQDGTVERIAKESLPRPFSLLSMQEEKMEQDRTREQVQRLIGSRDRMQPRACGGLF